jgi:1,4-alpha-glucan branching enzyme
MSDHMALQQADDNVTRIVTATHSDPFSFLGMHEGGGNSVVVRAFLPGASRVRVTRAATNEIVGELSRVHPDGLFAGSVASARRLPYRLLVEADGTERTSTTLTASHPP